MKQLYCIPKIEEIDAFASFSEKYHAGFEYNDFFLPSVLDAPDAVRERIQQYWSLGRDTSEDTLHGAFFDICVNSDDPLIFAASDKRVHQSMDIAQELGVRAVIFHTNNIANFRLKSYREGWVKRNTAYWEKILREYPDSCIYIENMFDEEPELLLRLAENMQGEDHFGVCLDLAHAYLSGTPLEEWERQLKPYVKHLHINDNDRQEDTHQPVGSAGFPWQNYKTFLETFPEEEKPSVLIEVRGYQDLAASVEYMQKEKLYPFTERAL